MQPTLPAPFDDPETVSARSFRICSPGSSPGEHGFLELALLVRILAYLAPALTPA